MFYICLYLTPLVRNPTYYYFDNLIGVYNQPNGAVLRDTIAVHFSDESWVPTRSVDPGNFSHKLVELEKSTTPVNLYPNLASQSTYLTIEDLMGEAKLLLYSVDGRLSKRNTY